MPRIPDSSDITRVKRLTTSLSADKYGDPLKTRVATANRSFYTPYRPLALPPNFLFPTKVLPNTSVPNPPSPPSEPYTVPLTIDENIDFSVQDTTASIENTTITTGTPTGTDTSQYVLTISGGQNYNGIDTIEIIFDDNSDISGAGFEFPGVSFSFPSKNSFKIINLIGILTSPIVIKFSGTFTIVALSNVLVSSFYI